MKCLRLFALVAAISFAGCSGAPATLPEGMGRGLLHADAEPPAGVVTYARPDWRAGDAFTLVRGEVLTAKFTIETIDGRGYVVRGPGGMRLRRDLDLGNLGDWEPEGEEPLHLLSPRDVRFHWPLWVGKKWSCEFVDRARGGAAMKLQAEYEVEDLDTVKVPAGTFAALRIVRTLRLVDSDPVLTRTQVIWYAPSIGAEVRQIVADTEIELVEWRRSD